MKKALNLFEKRIVMSATNPIITTPEEQFVVGESDFAFFGNYASRCEGGAILYCRKGSAEATVNQYCGQVRRNTLILVLPGSLLMLTNRTEDFRMTFCAFSRDLFAEAGFRLEPSFFRILRENPITYPPARIVEGASTWFQMAAYTYRDRNNVFRNTIIRNRLQNVLLEIYDKLQRYARNDDAPDGAFPPFRRAGARTQFAAARGVVLCRQTLHFDTLSLDHRAQYRA